LSFRSDHQRWLLCSILVGLVALVPSSSPSKELEGEQRVELIIGGKQVAVVIQIGGDKDCKNPESVRWGVEGVCPDHRVSTLSVRYGGRAAFIPLSAYSDLTALRRTEVTPSPDGFDLVLRGGDAATSYSAILRFSTANKRKTPVLTSRTVRSSSNPDERNDHFEYHFASVDADY
jgi:hypothetical protein